MHILFITELYPEYENQPPLDMNPALHHFVTEWIASGVEVTVIVPIVTRNNFGFLTKGTLKKTTINGVRVVQIPMPKMPGFKIYHCSAIVRFAKTIAFDVIVSHMQIGLVAGSAVKKATDKPLIFGVHRSDNTVLDIPSPNLKKRLFKHTFLKILGNVDGFAFRSFSVKNLFLQNYDITGRPMTIAISGIPSSFIDPEPRFSYGKVPHIITSCKLRKQKNVHAVLDALAMLPKNLSWRYTIIGDGPERSALQKQVRHYQLESWVTFRGTIPREKNIQLMRQADIFIMISSSETLGMVYLEALAQGLLTIGSCNTGIDGFIHNKKNGFLCPPGDATSLAQTLMYVLKKHPMQIRENGYQTIINHGVQSTCSQNYLSFIANVLSRHIKK